MGVDGDKKKKAISSILLRWMKSRKSSSSTTTMSKSKSWSGGERALIGCFSVYVGAEKQRFVIKTELANHPLFKMLLEDAEVEYGFNGGGPLLLPCHVDLFSRVLAEMEEDYCGDDSHAHPACSFSTPFSPARRRSGYGLLTPLRSFS